MKYACLIALLIASTSIAAAQTPTDPQSGFITDEQGSFLTGVDSQRIFINGQTHTVAQHSVWPSLKIEIDMYIDFLDDKSAAYIYARAKENEAPVSVMSIYTIVNGQGRLLNSCPEYECEFNWPIGDMVQGLNEVEVLFTSPTHPNGFGTSTKISRP